MEGEFQRNSLGWQLHLMQRRLGEWIDGMLGSASFGGEDSPSQIPDWLSRLVFWVIVIGLGVWLLWQLYQVLRPYLYRAIALQPHTQPQNRDNDQKLTTEQWLGRSRTFAKQGNYREACRAVYLAVLRHLDDTQQIPYQDSRTDGEYRNLLTKAAQPQPLQLVLDTHEQLCFSDRPISAETFQQCQAAAQEVMTP